MKNRVGVNKGIVHLCGDARLACERIGVHQLPEIEIHGLIQELCARHGIPYVYEASLSTNSWPSPEGVYPDFWFEDGSVLEVKLNTYGGSALGKILRSKTFDSQFMRYAHCPAITGIYYFIVGKEIALQWLVDESYGWTDLSEPCGLASNVADYYLAERDRLAYERRPDPRRSMENVP